MQLNGSLKVDASKTTRNKHDSNPYDLKRGSHHTILLNSFRIVLSDCMNMMILSHYGISVVINVRLYDSQDKLKMGARKKNCPEFYIMTPYTASDCEYTDYTRNRSVGYHEKYMNDSNTSVYKKNSVCSSTHPHENSSATSVYIEKATYQMNSVNAGWDFMADRIII